MEQAIYDDCRQLIENFVKTGKTDFKSFAEEWKKMLFSYIYSAQTSSIELLQTTQTALYFAKRIIAKQLDKQLQVLDSVAMNEHNLRRIGGIYLLYGIYFKQQTGENIKVDVSMRLWKKITQFIEELPKEPPTNDVHFIFRKLVDAQAFRFTALDFYVGLEGLIEYDNLHAGKTNTNWLGGKLDNELHEFKEIKKMLPAMTQLEDEYNKMKEAVVSAEAGISRQALPATTVFQEINDAFQNIGKILRPSKLKTPEPIVTPEKINPRRAVKDKAMQLRSNAIQAEVEEQVVKKAKPYTRRVFPAIYKRLAARNIFVESLPEDIRGDLGDSIDDEEEEDMEELVNIALQE